MKIKNIPLPKRLRHQAAISLTVLSLSLGAITAQAQYTDPLDSQVVPMALAQQSLLLDVTQAGDRLVAVGERGHILYSNDQGKNWIQANVAVQSQLNAVFFINGKKGWAVGEDAVILHSKDGGLNWHKQFDDRDADIRGPLLDVHFKNTREGFAVGVFNKLYHTMNGGRTWDEWQAHSDNEDEWHLFAMATPSEDVFYVASEAGLLFKSMDGGDSFKAQQTDHEGSFHGILARRGRDGLDRLILSGVGGILFTSTNGGDSWLELNTQTQAGLSGGTFLKDGSALIVGADGIMLHLSQDLTSLTKMQRDNGLPLSNALVNKQGDIILVGLGGVQTINLSEVTDHE